MIRLLSILFMSLMIASNTWSEELALSNSASEASESGDAYDWDAAAGSFFDFYEDLEGWAPRYAYFTDEYMMGRAHYVGLSFFKRQGAALEGPTLRGGFGEKAKKLNLAYSSHFSFLGVDMGISYTFLDDDHPRSYHGHIEGLGLELGLRLWVVQVVGVHMEETSYVSLAYGF